MQRGLGLALLVLVFVLSKLDSRVTRGSCELPGRQVLSSARCPILMALSRDFYVSPKGQAVPQNVSWLEKTELML